MIQCKIVIYNYMNLLLQYRWWILSSFFEKKQSSLKHLQEYRHCQTHNISSSHSPHIHFDFTLSSSHSLTKGHVSDSTSKLFMYSTKNTYTANFQFSTCLLILLVIKVNSLDMFMGGGERFLVSASD